MSYIHIEHFHSLNHDVTRERVEQVAAYLNRKYKVHYYWKGNQLLSRHKGCVISARIENGYIELKIRLGMLFSPMKGKIEKALRRNLRSVVGDKNRAPKKVMLHEGI